jgi:hypothetical protein
MEAFDQSGITSIQGLEDVRTVDKWARSFAAELVGKVKSNV